MEKLFDIVCRVGGLTPSAVVLVCTVRALKHHGEGDDVVARFLDRYLPGAVRKAQQHDLEGG